VKVLLYFVVHCSIRIHLFSSRFLHRGYIPKVLGTRSKHGTPTYGIFIGTLIVVVMGVSDMSSLIEMLNFSYSM
jgi:amino acid permease